MILLHRNNASLVSVSRNYIILNMLIRVAALVFLFIIRLRFPSHISIAEVIRRRYGINMVKKLRKLEKLDYKVRKNEADIKYLKLCHQNKMVPKFLNFKLPNNNLRFSKTYKQCQLQLLQQEIRNKTAIIIRQRKELESLRINIKSLVSFIDYTHICCFFLLRNDRKLLKVSEVHAKKLKDLGIAKSTTHHDPDKVIFNYSSYKPSKEEKNLLAKG